MMQHDKHISSKQALFGCVCDDAWREDCLLS